MTVTEKDERESPQAAPDAEENNDKEIISDVEEEESKAVAEVSGDAEESESEAKEEAPSERSQEELTDEKTGDNAEEPVKNENSETLKEGDDKNVDGRNAEDDEEACKAEDTNNDGGNAEDDEEALKAEDTNNDSGNAEDDEEAFKAAREARAVSEATASADASYVPSPSLLSASSPLPLLRQVDGPDLRSYNGAPNVYSARSIPIGASGKLDVPIYITSGGSVVEYNITSEYYDISFGVIAERDEKETIVKEMGRVNSHEKAITGKFLVGSVPCTLIFSFDNGYSWLRQKVITYKILVTPPTKQNISAGRRRRAASALRAVEEDKASAEIRLGKATSQLTEMSEEIDKLEKELAERKKGLDVTKKEKDWLQERVDLRHTQVEMLSKRLNEGWEDED